MLKVRQTKSGTKGHGYEKNNLKKRKKRERKRNTTKSLENETREVKARLQHCYYTKLLKFSDSNLQFFFFKISQQVLKHYREVLGKTISYKNHNNEQNEDSQQTNKRR